MECCSREVEFWKWCHSVLEVPFLVPVRELGTALCPPRELCLFPKVVEDCQRPCLGRMEQLSQGRPACQRLRSALLPDRRERPTVKLQIIPVVVYGKSSYSKEILVLDCPVPPILLNKLPHAPAPDRDESTVHRVVDPRINNCLIMCNFQSR
jgi:hypothetical protein